MDRSCDVACRNACLMATFLVVVMSVAAEDQDRFAHQRAYDTRDILGWTLHVEQSLLKTSPELTEKAVVLLQQQLQQIIDVVPVSAVVRLKTVPLWFSPEYPGAGAHAEYHPGREWLIEHGRNPEMWRGVEFTNVLIFEAETERMPNFALHELAHAYHDRVFGYDDETIAKAFARAQDGHTYDMVERWNGRHSPRVRERAYAMSNPMEYFAETTEAYFARNDFFPFDRAELIQHDPEMAQLLAKAWGVEGEGEASPELVAIVAPPQGWNCPEFYTKSISAGGYPIVASPSVNDYALREAAYLVNLMLAKRPDVRNAMIKSGSRMCLIGWNEFTTDLPEFARLSPKDWWDARARGTGGSQDDPYCSAGEENLLKYPGDPYSSECILIHEFAHNIHLRGMSSVDPSFDDRVKATYESAMVQGLWKGKYASTNHHEYFAEGVQSWFDNNRPPDHDHNHVRTRAALKEYDPGLAKLCEEVFGETKLVYTDPTQRLTGHLHGYDPATAPTFVWPERLQKAQAEIRSEAMKRSEQGK